MRTTLALLFVAVTAAAQSPEVPHKMDFAGISLTIRDDARREIQKDVNALTQSPRHHLIKVERARTYFPIIEKVFSEEQVPDDFKYLVLQESALIADAVSVSNAVGFWQFKDFTALEMGLRVDKEVDERLNLVSSTRAAARYIKKNNNFFDNWVYALQAYQMGAGGVMRSVGKSENGKKHMEVTSKTYWYVKKFLAHKIAFESAVGSPGQIKVIPYLSNNSKPLSELAREVAVDEMELLSYNKWAKRGVIPGDRPYTVLIPQKADGSPVNLPQVAQAMPVVAPVTTPAKASVQTAMKSRTKINGISAIRAEDNETAASLARRAGVSSAAFAKWNDIAETDNLKTDTYYLLGKKRVRATVAYHKAEAGEDLWKVSQRYGVQLKKLMRYNRTHDNVSLQPGETVWLSSLKPRNAPVNAPSRGPVVQVQEDESFAWSADPEGAAETIPVSPVALAPKEDEFVNLAEQHAASETPTQDEPVVTTLVRNDESASVPSEVVVATQEIAQSEPDIVRISPPDSMTTAPSPVINSKPAATGPTPAAPSKRVESHTVKQGETLYAIARQYGVSVMDLVNWNELDLQIGIKPGQVLSLIGEQDPAASVTTTSPATEALLEHIVKSTDTLYSVARKYNVTIKELMDWNKKKDFTLAIGEKLIVRAR